LFLVGEALMGKEPEIAHIDLLIGDKNGPVGTAFANGIAQLSAGHTPLLSVIRPNLPAKPATLIVPKVTVKGMDQASQIFGPAQTAVARAVADSVFEGVIPKEKAEDLVVIASVFIHPEARDFDAIYRYNYGATKLAIQRAMSGFPGYRSRALREGQVNPSDNGIPGHASVGCAVSPDRPGPGGPGRGEKGAIPDSR